MSKRNFGNRGQQNRQSRYCPMNDFNQSRSRSPNLLQSSLTPEQAAFEMEFSKWEKSFDDWKRAYANHDDRRAYQMYEQKFLDVREKLLLKRAQIYTQVIPLRTQLDMQLIAAESMAASILQKFGESSSSVPMNFNNTSSGGGYNNSRFGRNDNFNRSSSSEYRNRTPPPSLMDMNRGSSDRGMQRQNFNRDRSPLNRPGNSRDSRNRNQSNRRDNKTNQRQPDPNSKRAQRHEESLKATLKRKDVYPNTPWVTAPKVDKPALVGKRRKKKNAKINKVLEKQGKAKKDASLVSKTMAEKSARLLEEAKNAPCPNRMSGAARRRMVRLMGVDKSTWSPEEAEFMEYATYVRMAREKYFVEFFPDSEAPFGRPEEKSETNASVEPMDVSTNVVTESSAIENAKCESTTVESAKSMDEVEEEKLLADPVAEA